MSNKVKMDLQRLKRVRRVLAEKDGMELTPDQLQSKLEIAFDHIKNLMKVLGFDLTAQQVHDRLASDSDGKDGNCGPRSS